MQTIETQLTELRDTLLASVNKICDSEKLESSLFDSGTLETGITVSEPSSGRSHDFYIMQDDLLGDIAEDLSDTDLESISDQYFDLLDDIRIYGAMLIALEDIQANDFPEEDEKD